MLLLSAPLAENIKGGIAAFGVVVLLVFGIVYAVQNTKRTFFYSIWHTRFHRAEITLVDTYDTEVYLRWKPHTGRIWSVHVNWRGKDGVLQEEILETKSPLLGNLCERRSHVWIAEVRAGKRHFFRSGGAAFRAPKPMVFTPDERRGGLNYSREDGSACNTRADHEQGMRGFSPKRLFKTYFGLREDEPLVEAIPEREVMLLAQWRRHKIYSFLYMLLLLPIVLLLAVILFAFVLLPIIHALGFENPDAFFAYLRNARG